MAKKKAGTKTDSAASGAASSGAVEVAAEAAATFEESLAEVEGIVRQLESGQLTLGDSLRAYERGVRELRLCHEQLETVERRIELLIGFDAEGRPVTEPFEADSLTLEEKQNARGRRRGAQSGAQSGTQSSRRSDEGGAGLEGESGREGGSEAGSENSGTSRVDDSLGLF